MNEAERTKRTKRRGRPRVDGEIRAWIARKVAIGLDAATIYKLLGRQPQFRGRVPTDRSVRRQVAKLRGDDTTEWSLVDAEPAEASLVLPVLGEMIKQSYGRPVLRLRRGLADWIVRISRAVPDIPPSWALDVALNYWRLHLESEPTHGLDEMLAFAPWRSAQHYWDYLNEMGRLHREWFDAFERQESGHPMMALPGALWSNADAFGLVLAVEMHARGRVPPPVRRQKGSSNETR